MKRYLLFCSQVELTEGGWDDMRLDSDKITELVDHFEEANKAQGTWPSPDWAHIVDTKTGKKKLYYTDDLGWCAVTY